MVQHHFKMGTTFWNSKMVQHHFKTGQIPKWGTTDTGARKDIPSDILQRFNVHYPICIVPDGNCFCRSISHLVYGSEHHHVEMRCRIVIDSVLNLNNYTDHDYLMRCANHEHKNCSNIAEYHCCYSGVKSVGSRDQSLKGIKSVFREDVMRICK